MNVGTVEGGSWPGTVPERVVFKARLGVKVGEPKEEARRQLEAKVDEIADGDPWLKENRPDVWAESSKFLCFEDLLQHRLGLDPAISWSLAGRTMLFDVRKHAWSDEILGRIGLDAGSVRPPAHPEATGSAQRGEVLPQIQSSSNAAVRCDHQDRSSGSRTVAHRLVPSSARFSSHRDARL